MQPKSTKQVPVVDERVDKRYGRNFRKVCISASPTANVTLCNNGKGFRGGQAVALMHIWMDVLAQGVYQAVF